MLTLVEGIVSTIEGLLALHHTVLERTNLALTLLVLGLGGLLVLDDLLFSLEQSLFFEGLGLTLSITDQGLSLCVVPTESFRRPREDYPAWRCACRQWRRWHLKRCQRTLR